MITIVPSLAVLLENDFSQDIDSDKIVGNVNFEMCVPSLNET